MSASLSPNPSPKLNDTLADFLRQNPQFQRLVVSAVIIHRDKLLIVQRSADEVSYRNKWEIPGGSVDPSDPSIRDALVREVFEETGLHVDKILTERMGNGTVFRTGRRNHMKTWLKNSYVVEVRRGSWDNPVAVTLDPKEHQNFLWVTKEQVLRDDVDGYRLEFVSEEQKNVMLLGFEAWKDVWKQT